MIVDDDELSRDLLTVLLEAEGYLVDVAESGDAALAALQTDGLPRPDAVLTDVQMPGLTGTALAARLRAICDDRTRVLAMSGSRPRPGALEGFDTFLLKPFSMEDVSSALQGVAQETTSCGEKPAETETVLDASTFHDLSEMMRPGQMAELYGMGLRDAEGHVSAMRAAAVRGDGPEFKRRAHAMKGSFGMLGARDLQALAAEMEVRGPNDTNDVAMLERFTLAMGDLRRILMARGLRIDSPGNRGDGT